MRGSSAPALHTRRWTSGGSDPPPLVLLHGFTQNSNCWGPFAEILAADHPVFGFDAPGHGRSGHDDADLWTAADLVATTIEQSATAEFGMAPPVVVGYSMGGRVALHLALSNPTAVAGLVLIGATAGIDDEADRVARLAADEALATRIESEPLPQFIDWWLANPLFAGLDAEAGCRAERLANRPDGLAASLRHCGTGSQEPLWERLGELAVPVLAIVGRRDGKFAALARRMATAVSGSDVSVVEIDGSHAVHLEQPVATAAAIREWLKSRSSP